MVTSNHVVQHTFLRVYACIQRIDAPTMHFGPASSNLRGRIILTGTFGHVFRAKSRIIRGAVSGMVSVYWQQMICAFGQIRKSPFLRLSQFASWRFRLYLTEPIQLPTK